MTKIISVFGSAAPQPGSSAYETARRVGQLLAEAGFAVATGGYSGTMTAVSQGASEAGGHVIGVTSAQIEQFRMLGVNQWVAEEIKYDSLRDRLMHLVLRNDGMITLPGGIGTISEMTLAWSFLQVGEMEKRPLALLGDMWRNGIQAFYRSEYIKPEYMALLYYADSPKTAVAHVAANVEREL
ncbi:MAG: LOG family protein [Chloroflexi bacterium]|nr:LOG family protein [Chloroflexota bacterium]